MVILPRTTQHSPLAKQLYIYHMEGESGVQIPAEIKNESDLLDHFWQNPDDCNIASRFTIICHSLLACLTIICNCWDKSYTKLTRL